MILFIGFCVLGYYCVGKLIIVIFNDIMIGDLCIVGYYCLEGIVVFIFCFDGKYMINIGVVECWNCILGYYCIIGFIFDDCFLGYYCFEGIG